MPEFGDYPGYESVVFTVAVEAYAVPTSLYFSMERGGDRDFVFVPDATTAQTYPRAFESYKHSAGLRSIFRYLGGQEIEIPLGDSLTVPVARGSEVRFAIVRWSKSSLAPFPREIFCLQRVSLAGVEGPVHEIVAASRVKHDDAGAVK